MENFHSEEATYRVETYVIKSETCQKVDGEIHLTDSSKVWNFPIGDLPVDEIFRIDLNIHIIVTAKDKVKIKFYENYYPEWMEFLPEEYLNIKIRAYKEALKKYEMEELSERSARYSIELNKVLNLFEAKKQAANILYSIESHVTNQLSKTYDVIKEEQEAKRKFEAEEQKRSKPYTYNNTSYPAKDGIPSIPLNEVVNFPIEELATLDAISVVEKIDVNGTAVNPLFTLLVINENLIAARFIKTQVNENSYFLGGFDYKSFMNHLTINPSITIIDTHMDAAHFVIKFVVTVSGENFAVMLNKILSTINLAVDGHYKGLDTY